MFLKLNLRRGSFRVLLVLGLACGLLTLSWLLVSRAAGLPVAPGQMSEVGNADIKLIPVASLGETSSITLTISGPDTAALNKIVTYTVNFTISGVLGIEYQTPSNFVVASTDPTTSTSGGNILRWDQSKLTGRHFITITGKHNSVSCPAAKHVVGFYDIYNPGVLISAAFKETAVGSCTYLPLVLDDYPWVSPLGVESSLSLSSGTLLTRTLDLKTGYVRLNGRISWRSLQPNEGDDIQWNLLADFEDELRALKAAGLIPIVVVDDYPRWATINDVRNDGQPTSCGPLRDDRFDDFAQFVSALVARYKTGEFNVHNWELGNEPDVDPDLVKPDNVFGCWGDIDDPYYGGEYYGEMLKVAGEAIKGEDSMARVWIGGLLLDTPNTTNPYRGKPELFLQGILEAGAAPYFDIVPYHSYPPYINQRIDHDNAIGGPWDAWGGGYVGKARYLRQLMSQYGVDKPVFLNETGLMCPSYYTWCDPPDEQFFQMQADHVVRAFVRGMSENIMGFVWFTLNGPGWRYTGLLDGDANPKPVYTAYQQLALQLQYTRYVEAVDYGDGIEAYAFHKGPEYVHVVWAEEDKHFDITVPQSKFVAAYDRDGNVLTPTLQGSNDVLQVQFEPIYILRTP